MHTFFTFLKVHKSVIIVTVVTSLLVVSVAINALLFVKIGFLHKNPFERNPLFGQHQTLEQQQMPMNTMMNGQVIDAPYGVRSSMYSQYENGKWKSYATTTPLTQEEVSQMQTDMIRREQAMDEYFARQQELMNEFWQQRW